MIEFVRMIGSRSTFRHHYDWSSTGPFKAHLGEEQSKGSKGHRAWQQAIHWIQNPAKVVMQLQYRPLGLKRGVESTESTEPSQLSSEPVGKTFKVCMAAIDGLMYQYR